MRAGPFLGKKCGDKAEQWFASVNSVSDVSESPQYMSVNTVRCPCKPPVPVCHTVNSVSGVPVNLQYMCVMLLTVCQMSLKALSNCVLTACQVADKAQRQRNCWSLNTNTDT